MCICNIWIWDLGHRCVLSFHPNMPKASCNRRTTSYISIPMVSLFFFVFVCVLWVEHSTRKRYCVQLCNEPYLKGIWLGSAAATGIDDAFRKNSILRAFWVQEHEIQQHTICDCGECIPNRPKQILTSSSSNTNPDVEAFKMHFFSARPYFHVALSISFLVPYFLLLGVCSFHFALVFIAIQSLRIWELQSCVPHTHRWRCF